MQNLSCDSDKQLLFRLQPPISADCLALITDMSVKLILKDSREQSQPPEGEIYCKHLLTLACSSQKCPREC